MAAFADESSVFSMDDEAPPPPTGATATTQSVPNESASAAGPAADLNARDLDSGTGTLAASAISSTMKKNQWAVQDCAARLGGAGFAGRMVVEWEILETGSVANARIVESNLRNPPFETCILMSVRRMRFSMPTGGTVITTHPFVFQQ